MVAMRAVRGAVVARMGTVTTTQPLAAHALGRFAHPAGGSSGGGSGYAGSYAGDAACVYDRSATGASTGPQGVGGSRGGRADGPCSTRSTAAGLGFAMHGLVGVRGMASNKVHENVRPVLTADMRRIVDIGGMKAEAIAKMPANRPVVAELGGAKISPSVLHSMLQTLRQLKQTNRLIEVLEWAITEHKMPTCKHFAVGLRACKESGSLKQGLKLLLTMHDHGIAINVYAYTLVLEQCAMASDEESAGLVLQQMAEDGVHPNEYTFTALLKLYGRTGSVDKAEAVFNAMEPSGVPPNVIHYTALLTALEAGGHWTRALDVYNQMKARGVGVTLHTISTILSVCAKGHMVDQAVAIFHEAKAAGIRGDVFTYSALISVFAEAGDAPQALQAFHEMQALGITPNAVTYNALLAVANKAKLWEMALEVFSDMSQRRLPMTVETFNPLIGALAHSYQPRLAMDAFENMQRLGIAPDMGIFSTVLEMCLLNHEWGEARKFLNIMAQHDCFKERVKDDSDAYAMFGVSQYNRVLNGMWEAGRCRDAANTMLQALEAGVYPLSETAKVHSFSEGMRVDSLRLDLHAHSVGAAQARAAMWLLQLKEMMQTGEGKAHRTVGFIPGQGHFKQHTGDGLRPRSVINEALQAWLKQLDSPFAVNKSNPGVIDCEWGAAREWILTLDKELLLPVNRDHEKHAALLHPDQPIAHPQDSLAQPLLTELQQGEQGAAPPA